MRKAMRRKMPRTAPTVAPTMVAMRVLEVCPDREVGIAEEEEEPDGGTVEEGDGLVGAMFDPEADCEPTLEVIEELAEGTTLDTLGEEVVADGLADISVLLAVDGAAVGVAVVNPVFGMPIDAGSVEPPHTQSGPSGIWTNVVRPEIRKGRHGWTE
jgi:hypothetical protein